MNPTHITEDIISISVFGFIFIAVAASLTAYLVAQFIDVQLFHFWKKLTNGKHLWLRNNTSTFSSQFINTFTVLMLLCSFGVIEWKLLGILLLSGYLFNVMVALLDTSIIYFIVYIFKRRFKMINTHDELQF
ncbi:MAG: queuosine precursor transporter [Bacteroidetes bacterium]|nr:queuosine precursor transporter [Bacteroidota bacterium]